MDEFEVRDEHIEAILKRIAEIISDWTPEGWGFCLMMFTFGEGGNFFYVSDAQREDIIRTMKEFIAKQEKKLH